MKQRHGKIQDLLTAWKVGDIAQVIQKLNANTDTIVTYDFLKSTFNDNKHIEYLNYQHIAQLLPHMQKVVALKQEVHCLCGLNSNGDMVPGTF